MKNSQPDHHQIALRYFKYLWDKGTVFERKRLKNQLWTLPPERADKEAVALFFLAAMKPGEPPLDCPAHVAYAWFKLVTWHEQRVIGNALRCHAGNIARDIGVELVDVLSLYRAVFHELVETELASSRRIDRVQERRSTDSDFFICTSVSISER